MKATQWPRHRTSFVQGLDYNLAFVNHREPTRWLREVSASAAVPVLNDGGQWIAEVSAIAKHLDREYQTSQPDTLHVPRAGLLLQPFLRAYLLANDSCAFASGVDLRRQLDEVEAYITAAAPAHSGCNICAEDALLVRFSSCTLKVHMDLSSSSSACASHLVHCYLLAVVSRCSSCVKCLDGLVSIVVLCSCQLYSTLLLLCRTSNM